MADLRRVVGLARTLVGNFTASLLAFLCALAWDRREKRHERDAEQTSYAQRAADGVEEELAARRSEAQGRFRLILEELTINAKSFQDASGSLHDRIVLPQLLDGSWVASGAALGAITSDYELVAGLSTFYGRVRELQWRLRQRLEITNQEERRVFDNMTEPLIVELQGEVAGLIDRVRGQIAEPGVIEVAIMPALTVMFAPAVQAASEAAHRGGRH